MMAEVARLFPDAEPPRGDAALTEGVRIAEALLFAAREPLTEAAIAARLPAEVAVASVLARLRADYAGRGVVLARVGPAKWFFRTADDLGWLLSDRAREVRRLSRPAMETLAIIAYHQPTTRAEIEEIRGVAVSKGTLDVLLEAGWVKLRGRRRAPGRPITYGTTEAFLVQFGLESVADLPGLDELGGAGLFDGRIGGGLPILPPHDGALRDDEDPLHEEPEEVAAPEPDLDPDDGGGDGDDLHPEDLHLEDPDNLDRDPFA